MPLSKPTFSIVNEYEVKGGLVYHFDFYRIDNEEEVYDMWRECVDEEKRWADYLFKDGSMIGLNANLVQNPGYTLKPNKTHYIFSIGKVCF